MMWGGGRGWWCSPSRHWEAPDLLQALIDRLVALPPGAVYVVIGALAAAENVFPPVPAVVVAAAQKTLAKIHS